MTSVLGSGRAPGGPSGQLRCKSKRRRRRRSKRKGKRDVIFLLFSSPTPSACHLHGIGCSQLYCQRPALAGTGPALPRRPGPGGRCLPRAQPGTGAAAAVPAAGHGSVPSPRCAGPGLSPPGAAGARQAPSGAGRCSGAVPGLRQPRPCPFPAAVPSGAPRVPVPAGGRCRGAEPPGAVAPSKLPRLSFSRRGPPSFSVLVVFPVPERAPVRKALIAVSRKSKATGCHCEQGMCPRLQLFARLSCFLL